PSITPISLSFLSISPSTTDIYTLSLHDALPISHPRYYFELICMLTLLFTLYLEKLTAQWFEKKSKLLLALPLVILVLCPFQTTGDRKSTRLNSSHLGISYAVFCLKKKKKKYLIQ